MEVLDQDKREELADIYSQIQQGNRKWRIRQIIAGQIGLLSKLFLEETIVKIIIPISFQLCKDDVASVREAACEQISNLLQHNKGRALCELLIVENIKSFASYNRFTLRQAFVLMCDGLLEDWVFFQTHFLPLFEKLADDKVSNVRIGLAKVLARHFERKSAASKEETILKIYKKLAKDTAADVVKVLRKEHTIIDEVISSSSDDHNASRNISEDFHSEERKQEEEDLMEKIQQVKAHSQEDHEIKEDVHSPLLESEKDILPPKEIQEEIEKIVEAKQVEDTEVVKEAIEEAKAEMEKHEHKHDEEEPHLTQETEKEPAQENINAPAEPETKEEIISDKISVEEKPIQDDKMVTQDTTGDQKPLDETTAITQEENTTEPAEI